MNTDATTYAPVLERMIEILGAVDAEHAKFEEAMDRASNELGVKIPEHMEGPIYVAAFRIISGKKLPGAPNA